MNFTFNIVHISPKDYTHSATFDELIETLLYGLQKLGFLTHVSVNQIIPEERNIIVGAHLIQPELIPLIPKNSIIYNTEQFSNESTWLHNLLPIVTQFETWDYNLTNIHFLSQYPRTQPLHYIPIGFCPSLERIPTNIHQDIDVLFYGCINQRRAHILNELHANGLVVHHAYNCYGQERDALIARSKVVLNLHFYESKIFEIVRVSYLLSNHKAVVAEIDTDTHIDPRYQNTVKGVPYHQLTNACKVLVHHEKERKTQEKQGFNIFSQIRIEDCLAPIIYTQPII